VSLSPSGVGSSADAYEDGWRAINRLLEQGYSWSGNERNAAFLNAGAGPFVDVGALAGLDYADDGRAVARVDWDLDGNEDLLVVNRTGPRLRLLQNASTNPGHALQLRLEGRDCNRDAIGARVEVLLGGDGPDAGRRLVQTRRSSEGYLAQSSAWLHFGLGDAPVAAVTVRWPDGSTDLIEGLEAGERVVLVQGDVPRTDASTVVPALVPAPIPAPVRRGAARVLLPEPVPVPRLGVESGDGRAGTLFGVGVRAARVTSGDRPLLLNLWASWCAPCRGELTGLTAAAESLRAAGLDVLALSVDEPSDRDAAAAVLEQIGWPFPSGWATPAAVETLDVLQAAARGSGRRMPVPTSLLIDTRGQVIAVYAGPVTAEQVLADLELLDASPAARLEAALPFAGQWRTQPDGATLALLRRALEQHGLPAAAAEFHPGAIHLEFGRARLEQGRAEDAERQFRAALDSDGDPRTAWAGLAYALQLQERRDEAVQAYRSALRWAPDDDAVLYNLGIALLALGRVEEAGDVAQRLRQLDSRFAAPMAARLRDARER